MTKVGSGDGLGVHEVVQAGKWLCLSIGACGGAGTSGRLS